MKKYLPYIAILTAMLIWALSGAVVKIGLLSFSPLTLIVIRFTMAFLVMLAIGLVCRYVYPSMGLQRVAKKDWILFIAGGFFQPCLYYLVETYAYQLISSPTIAEALMSSSPLLAPIFAAVFLRERVTWNQVLGIVISSVGMFLLVLVGSESFDIGHPMGVLLAFVAVCIAIMYSVMIRRIPPKYNTMTIVFYTQGMALLFFYPLWAIFDLPAMSWHFDQGVGQSLLAACFLAFFSTTGGFLLFCYALRHLGLTRTNIFNNIRPLFTALFMIMLYSEHLPLAKWAGMGLVIVGLFICQYRSPKVH